MSRDTLLLVTTSYPDRSDGSEAAGAFVADLSRQLALRLPVRVVAPGRDVGPEPAVDGVSVIRFASPGRPLSLLSPSRPSDWIDILRTMASLRRQTLAANADGRVKHVLALWVLPSGWAASVLGRASGVPYSVWALGSDIWTLGRLPGVRRVLRRVARGAHARFADGLRLGEDAGAIAGVPFEFLPSTRKLVFDGPSSRGVPPFRMIFLGRWHLNKGIDLLLDALDLLGPSDWPLLREVHIAGGGPLEPLVHARVARLRAQGRPVRLSGFLDSRAAASAIAEADWLLIPSRVESIPVVFSDAMNLGCPVVSMPVGDLSALVESVPSCGIVAESVSAPAFAGAMAKALRDAPGRHDAGIRAAAARFDMESVVCRILHVMAQAGQPGREG